MIRKLLLILFLPFCSNAQEFIAYYNPNCRCCLSYFSKLEKDGIKVKRISVSINELNKIKNQFNIPSHLRSCHTIIYNGKFIEGHVPIDAIRKLMNEKDIIGIASPHSTKSGLGDYESNYFILRANGNKVKK
ncbi:MAG: DUF411 domain-containing protein [candidate division WOR-3 bacterium]|jgi:hypothetical protein